MRVGIIADPAYPVPPLKYGGTEQIIYYLVKGLQESGHKPVLFAPGDSSVDCELVPTTEKAIYLPAQKKDIPANEKLVARIHKHTEQLIRQHIDNLDVVHSHGFDMINFQNVPNLTTIHGPINFIDLSYYLERKDLYYVSISQNQQVACPDLQYVGVVYNGLDPTMFPIVTDPEDYVCFLGRFDREKNPHLAIQLAINLGINIKVAGKVDYLGEGYFDEEVAKYFDHPLVEYLGEIGFDEKVELLSKARCNVHPTGFREPFGLTVLEAAYCGTPTMAISRGSMSELIEIGRTGTLVEDFVEGYHQIKECFGMDRNYIAQRARLLFNYKTMTKQYVKAYEQVIDIYRTRREHDSVVRQLTHGATAALQDIWHDSHQPQAKNGIQDRPKSHKQQADDDQLPISPEEAVDDRNTLESQLIGKTYPPRSSQFMTLQLKKYLSDSKYPATRQQLHDHALAKGASQETLAAISRLLRNNYHSYDNVKDEFKNKSL